MAYDLIIDASSDQERIALLKDNKLVELHQEQNERSFAVGEIYLGKVKKLMPGLNAAFVDVGFEKDAFLHYHDLGPFIKSLVKITNSSRAGGIKTGDLANFELEPETLKTGKVSDLLKKNQEILVQITKEPISSKGPRLNTEISISGRYFILVPFLDSVSISKKIESAEERKRLKTLATSLKPIKMGLIIRTAAEGKGGAELHADIKELVEKWESIFTKLPTAKVADLIVGEPGKSLSVVRDMLSFDFNQLHVNDKNLYAELHLLLDQFNKDLAKKLRLYKFKEPIFEHFGVDKQIKTSFGKTVSCNGGTYLIIEHTEALHSIDVNSGSRQNKSANQEENALATNLEAAEEIARQLRLRDMGGIIVVDFIDLRSPKYKKQLADTLRTAMADDRAKHTVLPMSRFGLIEITRQRVRPEMNISTSEKCPVCKGTGSVVSNAGIMDDIEEHLDHLVTRTKHKKLTLVSNPYFIAYLKGGFPSKRLLWFQKYKKWISLQIDNSCSLTDFRFEGESGDTIALDLD